MTKKILTIGNAIVDILCKVDDAFLEKNSLIKSSMSLIDEATAQELSGVNSEKITSGGSAGNTAAALAQLGNKTTFIGKVGHDDFGKKFISEIEKSGADFLRNKNHHKPTAKSFILVTPDANRTMCTFLGCASEITEFDIEEKAFQGASILYLEGYLWDAPATILALKKAISLAKKNGAKVAFSLSDSFCVARHKADFLELIQNDLDILFANEDEALELAPNFVKIFAQNKKLIAVVTKSEKGCEVFAGEKSVKIAAEKIEKLVDTTGAGDAFAAGFLHGLVNDFDLEKSAKLGNLIASKIIQKFGARFEKDELINLF
ncbi:MAG: adenosine kinase [Rickettsiales bacterium]|nr:adenosine kinase [Rickettsiales bacterium]